MDFYRYINHASVNYNLILMKPVMVGDPPSQRLRIGFVARWGIKTGDELFFNYGIRDRELPWLKTNAKKAATKLPPPLLPKTSSKKVNV